jgi:hypothetical protein
MDDFCSALLALALSSVMLVMGQQYLSKKPEITAARSATRAHAAANSPIADAR